MSAPTTSELTALAEKYREMIALRTDAGPKDNRRLQALASRFPGALRELDTRSIESLRERLVEVERALGGAAPPDWASLQIRFHGWVRVALRARANGARDLASARVWASVYRPEAPGEPDPSSLDDVTLMRLVDPPEGRVSLGARTLLGVGEVDLDGLLFGTR